MTHSTEEAREAEAEREYYTLPEQRIRVVVKPGGRGAWHVVEYRTDPAWIHPGRWTRRAASRRAFCGSLSALLVGIDAADWPTERIKPDDLHLVTCARCIAAAERRFRPAAPSEEVRDDEQ